MTTHAVTTEAVRLPQVSADDFTPTEHLSAEDKVKLVRQLAAFLVLGMPRRQFSNWLYARLCRMFGHIAHYNLDGFYTEWFSTEERKLAFLRHVAAWRPHGDSAYCCSDVEAVIVNWLATTQLVETQEQRARSARENVERAVLNELIPRHSEHARDVLGGLNG